jgi:hypothetical protein
MSRVSLHVSGLLGYGECKDGHYCTNSIPPSPCSESLTAALTYTYSGHSKPSGFGVGVGRVCFGEQIQALIGQRL